MVFDRFTPEGVVFFLPEVIPNWQELKKPIPARFYSAHFCFTLGEFSTEFNTTQNIIFTEKKYQLLLELILTDMIYSIHIKL
jgi:hypothetical protein